VFFELGDGCVYEWFKGRGLQTRVVYDWGSLPVEKGAWSIPDNIYRRGDQSQLLVRDKHSDAWDASDAADKQRLTDMCFNDNV
jgi:hypothetical protein